MKQIELLLLRDIPPVIFIGGPELLYNIADDDSLLLYSIAIAGYDKTNYHLIDRETEIAITLQYDKDAMQKWIFNQISERQVKIVITKKKGYKLAWVSPLSSSMLNIAFIKE